MDDIFGTWTSCGPLTRHKFSCSKIYLWRKEGSLFCFVFCLYQMRSTEPWCFSLDLILGLFGKLSREGGGGCMGLVSWHLDLHYKSSWILNDFFIENQIKLNRSWKFWKKLEFAFGVVGKILMSKDLMEFFW